MYKGYGMNKKGSFPNENKPSFRTNLDVYFKEVQNTRRNKSPLSTRNSNFDPIDIERKRSIEKASEIYSGKNASSILRNDKNNKYFYGNQAAQINSLKNRVINHTKIPTFDELKLILNLLTDQQKLSLVENSLLVAKLKLQFIRTLTISENLKRLRVNIDEILLEEALERDPEKKKELEQMEEKQHEEVKNKLTNLSSKILNSNTSVKENISNINDFGQLLKEHIDYEIKKDPDNYIKVDQIKNINNNKEVKIKNNFVLSCLGKALNNEGIETYIEKKCKNENIMNGVTQIIMSGLANSSVYEFRFDFGKMNEQYLNNPIKRKQLEDEIIMNISNEYDIPKYNIQLMNFRAGSVKVDCHIRGSEGINMQTIKPKMKHCISITNRILLEKCLISPELFDEAGNSHGMNYEKSNFFRGGEKYDPPYNWDGYGLKVLDKYDGGNNQWLACDGNKNEWAVAYHGVGGKEEEIYYRVGKIAEQGLKKMKGGRQLYANELNKRYEKNKEYKYCGEGVYLTPIINKATCFAGEVGFDDSKDKYKIVFMCRVNPKKIREPERDNKPPYWILNGDSSEIRPYRILVQKIN